MGRAIDDGLDVFDDDEDQPEPKRRRGLGALLLIVVTLVLVIPVAVVGFYGGRAFLALNSMDRDETLDPVEYEGRPASVSPKPVPEGEDPTDPPVHFVLMGTDSREDDDGGRSDSLMVAHVTGDRQAVYLVSFPRDMWVDIPGRGMGKINWAYSFGGPQLTVRTLEQMLDVRMDHTVQIDFEGFIRLTDAIGGVTVHNPWTSGQDGGMSFPEGEVHLQGERALAYVRERYQLPNGDLDRAFRQRTVVKAIIRKVMTPETLLNPGTFSDVVGKIADTMRVDTGMTNGYVTDLALSMRLTGGESIGLLQAPITGFATVQGQSVDVVDLAALEELATAFAEDTMDEYFAEHGNAAQEKLGQVEPPE